MLPELHHLTFFLHHGAKPVRERSCSRGDDRHQAARRKRDFPRTLAKARPSEVVTLHNQAQNKLGTDVLPNKGEIFEWTEAQGLF